MSGPLKNHRHEKFVQAYLKDPWPARAYMAAGFRTTNERSAKVAGNRLLSDPKVQERLAEIQKKTERVFIASEIADRTTRVLALQDRWRRLQQVIDERAKSDEMATAPGGKTGLLCRRLKMIGSGKDAEVVEEFEVDTATLRETRAHEEQAARELGQWTENSRVELKMTPLEDVLTRRYARAKRNP